MIFNSKVLSMKTYFTYGPGPLIPSAGLTFLIYFRYAHNRFKLDVSCSPDKTIGLAAATRGRNFFRANVPLNAE
jgi:hypothetical protein